MRENVLRGSFLFLNGNSALSIKSGKAMMDEKSNSIVDALFGEGEMMKNALENYHINYMENLRMDLMLYHVSSLFTISLKMKQHLMDLFKMSTILVKWVVTL